MNDFLKPATCTDENLIKIYAHADCAAFADILQWNFINNGLDSKIIMAGNRLQNHFYIKIQINNKETLYCDAYGIYEYDIDILDRYDFTYEDINEIENYEEDKLFRTLVESSFAYEMIEDSESKQEEFFDKMQDVFLNWRDALSILNLENDSSELSA